MATSSRRAMATMATPWACDDTSAQTQPSSIRICQRPPKRLRPKQCRHQINRCTIQDQRRKLGLQIQQLWRAPRRQMFGKRAKTQGFRRSASAADQTRTVDGQLVKQRSDHNLASNEVVVIPKALTRLQVHLANFHCPCIIPIHPVLARNAVNAPTTNKLVQAVVGPVKCHLNGVMQIRERLVATPAVYAPLPFGTIWPRFHHTPHFGMVS